MLSPGKSVVNVVFSIVVARNVRLGLDLGIKANIFGLGLVGLGLAVELES